MASIEVHAENEIRTETVWDAEKKVNKRGGITIPAHIRRDKDIAPGDKFKIYVLSNGDLHLEKITGRCASCGKVAYYREAEGYFLCDQCRKEMEEESEC